VTALANYPYDEGELKLDYNSQGGLGSLIVNGPTGRRQLDIYLHPWTKTDASSKVANTADNK